MHHCSVDYPPEVSEFAESGLTPAAAPKVGPPRIAESPVSMECRLHTHLDLDTRDLLVGEIVWMHVRDGIVDPATLRVTPEYAPVGTPLREPVHAHARPRRPRAERLRPGDAAAGTGLTATLTPRAQSTGVPRGTR